MLLASQWRQRPHTDRWIVSDGQLVDVRNRWNRRYRTWTRRRLCHTVLHRRPQTSQDDRGTVRIRTCNERHHGSLGRYGVHSHSCGLHRYRDHRNIPPWLLRHRWSIRRLYIQDDDGTLRNSDRNRLYARIIRIHPRRGYVRTDHGQRRRYRGDVQPA